MHVSTHSPPTDRTARRIDPGLRPSPDRHFAVSMRNAVARLENSPLFLAEKSARRIYAREGHGILFI
jgi:hypothetical protein